MSAFPALLDACHGRDLSPEAIAEFALLAKDTTDDRIHEVLRHLRHLPVVRTDTIDICDETGELFQSRWTANIQRREAHRERIGKTAYWLGRQVGNWELLLADAEKRLDRLTSQLDTDVTTPIRLLDTHEAKQLAASSFQRGINAARPRKNPA